MERKNNGRETEPKRRRRRKKKTKKRKQQGPPPDNQLPRAQILASTYRLLSLVFQKMAEQQPTQFQIPQEQLVAAPVVETKEQQQQQPQYMPQQQQQQFMDQQQQQQQMMMMQQQPQPTFEQQQPQLSSEMTHAATAQHQGTDASHVNLMVTYLPPTMNDVGLQQLFAPFGNIVSVRVMRDKQTRSFLFTVGGGGDWLVYVGLFVFAPSTAINLLFVFGFRRGQPRLWLRQVRQHDECSSSHR